MLRQACLRAASGLRLSGARAFTGTAQTQNTPEVQAFITKFKEVAPSTLEPPATPSSLLPADPTTTDGVTPSKVTLNFYLPHSVEYKAQEVDMVLVPATSGDFGVLPGHVPTIAQLKPGVMTVHSEMDKDVKKFFVSSGFAFVHPNSVCDVCAVEAVPLDQLDAAAVKAGLADYTNKVATAKDDYERATAQIGVEVYSAMDFAMAQV